MTDLLCISMELIEQYKAIINTHLINGIDNICIGYLYYALKRRYPSGKLREEVIIFDGKKEGEYKEYHENGNISTLCYFKNDRIEGEYKTWYPEGSLHMIRMYSNNQFNGLTLVFYGDGRKKHESYYSDGMLHGLSINYEEDGSYAKLAYSHNKPEGKLLTFNSRHILTGSVDYVDGRMHGNRFDYYTNDGTLMHTSEYKNDMMHGLSTTLFRNGKIKMTETYYEGKLHGESKKYARNGTLVLHANYRDGKLHGTHRTFNAADGSLLAVTEYIDDVARATV